MSDINKINAATEALNGALVDLLASGGVEAYDRYVEAARKCDRLAEDFFFSGSQESE